MAKLTLVLGGIRSGKSRFAEELVLAKGKKPVYVATAEIFNQEMQKRVDLHRARRHQYWLECEAPIALLAALLQYQGNSHAILVDCLTVWLGNLMHYEEDISQSIKSFVDGLSALDADIVLVSSEVGLGIVPDNALARAFCDHAGTLNQAIAAISSEVYFIAAGLPLKLKG
ncbi:bifunctional adenosylcobinamide kinase/adenosylcobinamide-phosphate guanylyltransferase [Bartonella sp. LJL80]